MTAYPGGVYSPRTKNNKSGVVYDVDKDTVGYAEDVTKLDDEVVAVETELGTNPKGNHADVKARLNDGSEVTAVPGADEKATGTKVILTAHENLTFGDVGYINSDGEVALGDASAAASSGIVAMCVDATISADASGNFLLLGIARNDAWTWTPGGTVYLSITGTSTNTLTQTAPTATDDVTKVVGVATHADRILFRPSMDYITHT